MSNPIRPIALLVGLALALVGCAGGGGGATPSAAPSAVAGDATIAVAESDLGQILVDADGKTLYGFLPDEGGTPTCYEGCAAAWPPLIADDPAAASVGAGLDQAKLGSAERTDGGMQLVYGGWPLYYFASDTAAGDTSGQGVGGNWFVVAPSGDLIEQ